MHYILKSVKEHAPILFCYFKNVFIILNQFYENLMICFLKTFILHRSYASYMMAVSSYVQDQDRQKSQHGHREEHMNSQPQLGSSGQLMAARKGRSVLFKDAAPERLP